MCIFDHLHRTPNTGHSLRPPSPPTLASGMDKVSQQLKNQNKGSKEVATTSNGAPVETITASQTAGERGPVLLQDFTLIDHLAAFDRERIPERVFFTHMFIRRPHVCCRSCMLKVLEPLDTLK